MDYKLEVVVVPVTDVDRAKDFYLTKLGFHLDADIQPTPEMRVVHMTPPGSACSVVIGPVQVPAGTDVGSGARYQLVVRDIEAARAQLTGAGVEASAIQTLEAASSSISPIPTATTGPCRRSASTSAPRASPSNRRAVSVAHPRRLGCLFIPGAGLSARYVLVWATGAYERSAKLSRDVRPRDGAPEDLGGFRWRSRPGWGLGSRPGRRGASGGPRRDGSGPPR
jgi:catechol 2,3-dioxygenase-like lactoylglutathione lyase family enzyme